MVSEVKYINYANYVFKEWRLDFILIEFTSCIPEACSKEAIKFSLNGSPEFSSWKLDSYSSLGGYIEGSVTEAIANVAFTDPRVADNNYFKFELFLRFLKHWGWSNLFINKFGLKMVKNIG